MTAPAVFPEPVTTDDLGGPKVDFDNVVDPTTDLSAAEFKRIIGTLAALACTGDKYWCLMPSSGTTPDDGDSSWGPSIEVEITRPATGRVTFTFEASYPTLHPDDASVSTTDLRAAFATLSSATAGMINAVVTSPTVIDVYTYSSAGAAADRAFSLHVK